MLVRAGAKDEVRCEDEDEGEGEDEGEVEGVDPPGRR